jgi:hypothetical protein
MIKLNIEPATPPISWNNFIKEKSPYSIALDGYVIGPPIFNESGPYQNFNHHEDVDRLGTRSTCAQVLIALRQGLTDTFNEMNIWVNDCDEDVCLSTFLLANPHIAMNAMNPLLNRLVSMEDMLDATAGAYPFPASLPTLEHMAWIFEPYRRFRISGEIDNRKEDGFRFVIETVHDRIMKHITGTASVIKLDTRYEVLGGGNSWSIVKEIGMNARTGMFSNGIRAFVSVRERPDGNLTVAIGRMSPYVKFNILKIIDAFNEAEGLTESPDRWGGGNTIAGSPRIAGTKLSLKDITNIIEEVIK